MILYMLYPCSLHAIYFFAVAVLGGFLYIAGGEEMNDQQSPVSTAHRYDPRTDTWLQIANMKKRRESFQLGVLTGMLYAVGELKRSKFHVARIFNDVYYNPIDAIYHSYRHIDESRISLCS